MRKIDQSGINEGYWNKFGINKLKDRFKYLINPYF